MSTALIDNTTFVEDMLGLGVVGRACQLLLIDKLNDEIEDVAERWKSADLELQQLTGSSVGQVDIEPVEAKNIDDAPHPSYLVSPPEIFPSVSIMAFTVQPDTDQMDQLHTAAVRMFVETVVKAGPVPDGQELGFETIVKRRIERTTEAVNRVILRDSTLRGTVRPIQSLPRGGIGNQSWVRREEKGQGPRFLWQGSRLEYALQRHAKF